MRRRLQDSVVVITWVSSRSTGTVEATTWIGRRCSSFEGPRIRPSQYSGFIDHYGVLRTLEDLCGLGDQDYLGGAADRVTPSGAFVPEPASVSLLGVASLGFLLVARRMRGGR
jgi:hypothetical protein